ncbi:serine/threonine protein kinase [Paraliomyxa miuraensis]|uniref:serine/threonine protein kinase n=1 Tax=Paraliomyxa miuraensis TaxID=376150 RepID=UPI0022549099|nr:serine/threonine-protein kinase [Paraliomyxa miuraensis]MCX4248100.1 protein kinase [Paraliomyxa miuraensis]
MPSTTPSTFTSAHHAYAVVRELGRGGQGRTLLVERQGEAGSRYVLKLLRLEHVDDWKQVELFEREVATLAALEHPGIPRLVDRIVEDERTAGIVQTFVEGRTLAEQIAEPEPMSAERFESILRQGLEILAYLHERVPPVLHRDINPRNVMLGPDRAYLIDFGAVKVGGKTDMTSVGTFGFMAPEQIIGRAEPASDVYGLGMTMVCVAERRDVGDLSHDPSTGQVDSSRLLARVSPRVRSVVLGMIKPGLGERLRDPREALRQLDAPQVPAVAPARAVAPDDGTPIRSPQRLALVLVSGALVAGLGFGLVLMKRSTPPVSVTTVPVAVPAVVPVEPVPPEPVPPEPVPPAIAPAVPVPVPVAPPIDPPALGDDDSAQLELTTTPAGATAFVDGKEVCTTPCTARVGYGQRRVRVELDGQIVNRELTVLEDTELHVSMPR